MLKELVTNVKPIGNGLVESVTDQCPISNGLLKSVTDRAINSVTDKFVLETHACRMRLLWLPPGLPFFSHRRRMLLSRLCLILSTPLAPSPQKLGHSCSDNNTRSLSLLKRSLTRSVCSDVPAGLSYSPPPAVRALRIALNFSPQKASAATGRPAARARRRKGQ
jgi:hypothetical protein